MEIPSSLDELLTLLRRQGVGRFRFTEIAAGGTVVEREIQLVGAVGPGSFGDEDKKTPQAKVSEDAPSAIDLARNPPKLDLSKDED